MKHTILIIMLLIIAVSTGGLIRYLTNSTNTPDVIQPVNQKQKVTNQTKKQEINQPLPTSISPPSFIPSTETISKTNCGIFNADPILRGAIEYQYLFTDEEIPDFDPSLLSDRWNTNDWNALNCFIEAIANCSPATIKQSSSIEETRFTILEKSEDYCMLSQETLVEIPKELKEQLQLDQIKQFFKCQIPISTFIRPKYELSESIGKIDGVNPARPGLFLLIQSVFNYKPEEIIPQSNGWFANKVITNFVTGTTVTTLCK